MEMITNLRSSWLLNKFSLLVTQEICSEKYMDNMHTDVRRLRVYAFFTKSFHFTVSRITKVNKS